jgi:ribosomal protein S18 acetylase RimI-like enzyme
VASALLCAFLDQCKEWEYDTVVFTTSEYQHAAIALYERWGFVKVKEKVRVLDEEGTYKLHIPFYRLNMVDAKYPPPRRRPAE